MNELERNSEERLRKKGYGIIPPPQYLTDLEMEFISVWEKCRAFTMTSVERAYALYSAVRYIVEQDIDGDIVECGVWKGGSCMLAALTLMSLGVKDRKIYLYDTFEGMTEPGNNDYIAWNNKHVGEKWKSDMRGDSNYFSCWAAGLEEVKKNLLQTGYPETQLIFVKGSVDESLPENDHQSIALLRLDTDWYESTRAELEYLYPIITKGGFLLVDDYGHFTGARKAVDEYFSRSGQSIFLNRVDYTGRIGIKT